MRLTIRVLCIALSIVLGASSAESRAIQSDRLTYRLLRADKLTIVGVQYAFYAVSIDRCLTRGDGGGLICGVLSEKKPESFVRLQVSVYHDLDESIPPAGAPTLEAKLRDHDLAYYMWNVKLPDVKNRLTVVRNTRG